MTREEAITRLKVLTDYEYDEDLEAFDMAIKALEHSERNVVAIVPCGDTISRQAVLDTEYQIKEINGIEYVMLSEVQMKIRKMPPVTPQPKTGYWKRFGNYWEDKFKCSECGKEQPKILCCERIIGHWSDYCPNCGAKMESEDKE